MANEIFTEEELKEMMRLLEEQGWQPRACDVLVPVYGNRVPCGQPSDVGDALVERHLSLPHAIVRSIKAYVIQARGNSMEDMGICDGDEVLVELCDTACDNEAVLVTLDGEMMIKLFVRDANGEVWLVPRNRAFRPIHVREGMELSIRARVLKVLKDTLRAPFGEIQACISEAARLERLGAEPPVRKDVRSLLLSAEKADDQMRRLDKLIRGQKGKRVALVVKCALELGWLAERPTFAALEEAFGDLGSKTGFHRMMQASDYFTKEEKEPILMALKG
ncbi:MAG: hypothetical protein IJ767_01850 [Bacteroidaceae bacterium]|nr:hypothetical protein [Bacteroidaceae bacterium]